MTAPYINGQTIETEPASRTAVVNPANGKTVGKVFIAGGSARSEFIVQSLQNELMVPCESWSPLKFLELALPPEKMGTLEEVAPQLTVAIGAGAASF